jgi:DnaK suppressor protein
VKKKDLNRMAELLQQQKRELLDKARKTLMEDMAMDVNELPDDMDFASSQADQGLMLRLRGREKTLLKKIEGALKRIGEGDFGVCEDCEEDIHFKRLEARPVTTLCIGCKEEQERKERLYL